MCEEREWINMEEKEEQAKKEEVEKKNEIIEVVVSVQRAGSERGKRIYFDSKSIEEIRKKCGEDFFLLTERTLIAFIDPAGQKITLTPLKGIYEKFLLR
ncbi:MAG: hypothetical protein ACXQTS_07310 [Candidatus Methanospirareceae archaeon]